MYVQAAKVSSNERIGDDTKKDDRICEKEGAFYARKTTLDNNNVIDYKMSNMKGFELYWEIRKIDEKVKVCFITAFEVYHEELKKKFRSSSNASPQCKQEVDVKCFIQKPIDIDELVQRIKEELNSWPTDCKEV